MKLLLVTAPKSQNCASPNHHQIMIEVKFSLNFLKFLWAYSNYTIMVCILFSHMCIMYFNDIHLYYHLCCYYHCFHAYDMCTVMSVEGRGQRSGISSLLPHGQNELSLLSLRGKRFTHRAIFPALPLSPLVPLLLSILQTGYCGHSGLPQSWWLMVTDSPGEGRLKTQQRCLD